MASITARPPNLHIRFVDTEVAAENSIRTAISSTGIRNGIARRINIHNRIAAWLVRPRPIGMLAVPVIIITGGNHQRHPMMAGVAVTCRARLQPIGEHVLCQIVTVEPR